MLPQNAETIRQLSQEEGIPKLTLNNSREEARSKGQLLPDADMSPQGWSSRGRLAAILNKAAHADLAEHCHKRGLYPAQIMAW